MVLKRTYQVDSKYTRPYKRTKAASLSRALAIRKPELKERFFRSNGGVAINTLVNTALNIPQGISSNERVGDQIRVMSVEVMGQPTNQGVGCSIICPKNAGVPVIGDFASGGSGYYDINKGWALAYYLPNSIQSGGSIGCSNGVFKYSFKMGMIQDYDGASVPLRNALYFCVPNNTGTAVDAVRDCTIRVLFYDV